MIGFLPPRTHLLNCQKRQKRKKNGPKLVFHSGEICHKGFHAHSGIILPESFIIPTSFFVFFVILVKKSEETVPQLLSILLYIRISFAFFLQAFIDIGIR